MYKFEFQYFIHYEKLLFSRILIGFILSYFDVRQEVKITLRVPYTLAYSIYRLLNVIFFHNPILHIFLYLCGEIGY